MRYEETTQRHYDQATATEKRETHLLQGIQDVHLGNLLNLLGDLLSGNFLVSHGFDGLVGVC